MIYEELKTFFRIYDSVDKQNRFFKPGSVDDVFKLICPYDGLLPWQFRIPVPVGDGYDLSSWKIVNAETDVEAFDLTANLASINNLRSVDGYDYLLFMGGTVGTLNMGNGFYYMTIVVNGHTYYSDVFNSQACMSWNDTEKPYLMLEVDNGEAVDLPPILYRVGWKQKIFLDTFIENETPSVEEEGVENGAKEFIPTLQRFINNLRFEILTNYVVGEALVLMCMHRRVILTTPNGIYNGQIKEMKPTMSQLQTGNIYSVAIDFQQETSYLNTSCGETIALLG